MRDWIKDFLLKLGDKNISEEQLNRELAIPVFSFRRPAELFNINWTNGRLTEIFGSVLADLPEDVFLRLLEIRNLFFFTETLGFVQALNFKPDKLAIVCVFAERILGLSDTKARAVIAHELSHVALDHYKAEIQERILAKD